MRQLVQMRLPEDLVRRVDEVAGDRGRTEFTIAALTDALRSFPEEAEPTIFERRFDLMRELAGREGECQVRHRVGSIDWIDSLVDGV